MARYIDAEELKVELDRQKIGYNIDGKHDAEYDTCVKIVRIIDSLQQKQSEEPIPKDLEEAANVYSNCYSNPDGALARAARRAYITGAKWDRERIMEEAVEITLDFTHQITLPFDGPGFGKKGDKVRVIICKKED